MTIFGREPVAWVAVFVAVAIAVIQTLLGEGIISDALAGQAVNTVNAIGQIAAIVVPIVVGAWLARKASTPVASPALPQGTQVTVITPGDTPNTKTTL